MNEPLRIGFAGSLVGYDPATDSTTTGGLKSWFWTFKPNNLNFHTRSGYFLFKGLEELNNRRKLTSQDLQIDIWGNIDSKNEAQVKAMGLSELVNIGGFCSLDESKAKLAKCDLLYLPLESEKDGQKPLFIPGKLYEYLQLRKPILALAGPSDCLDIIEGSGLGAVAAPTNTAQISELLEKLIDNKTGLAALYSANEDFISRYDMRLLTKKLAAIFDEVLES